MSQWITGRRLSAAPRKYFTYFLVGKQPRWLYNGKQKGKVESTFKDVERLATRFLTFRWSVLMTPVSMFMHLVVGPERVVQSQV